MGKTLCASIMDNQISNLSIICSKVIACCTIITYVLTDHQLSPQKVFKLVAWLETLRFVVFMALPLAMSFGLKAYYSSVRIQVKFTSGYVMHHYCNAVINGID